MGDVGSWQSARPGINSVHKRCRINDLGSLQVIASISRLSGKYTFTFLDVF